MRAVPNPIEDALRAVDHDALLASGDEVVVGGCRLRGRRGMSDESTANMARTASGSLG
jgi:hypothetical protein